MDTTSRSLPSESKHQKTTSCHSTSNLWGTGRTSSGGTHPDIIMSMTGPAAAKQFPERSAEAMVSLVARNCPQLIHFSAVTRQSRRPLRGL